jgi:signal transduction histidine kinase
MSHDIRTPLNGIIGMSQLLAEELQHPPHRQYALWVKESGQQLLSLLNGILDVVSSKNAVDLECQDESFNLRNVIHDLIQLEYPTIRLKNLELRIDIDKEIPQFIICDRTKLHRILLNLLGNAIKFTKIGHILIEIKLLAISNGRTHLLFRVVDTGIGIPEAIQKNVFEINMEENVNLIEIVQEAYQVLSFNAESKDIKLCLQIDKS